MSPYYARIYRERPKPTVFFLSNVFASTPILSTGSMLQYLSHLNKQQILGIGIAVVIVVVTLAIFYFANKWEEADRGELTDYSSLMDNHETSDVMIGSTDKYEWSQGEIEMEVFVNLSKYANGKQKLRAKDLKVGYQPFHP